MYFVHPQFKFNLKNIFLIKMAFLLPKQKKVEKELQKMFPQRLVYLTDMGRTAFKIILDELNIRNGEIIMPSFTCDIFLPILKAYNLTPVFIETNKNTFNFEIGEVEQKITPQTKAILAQHTFGLALDIEKITRLGKKYNLKVIEDCSHCFGAKYQGKYLGLFGEAAFFSLYKFFPCLRGGLALLKKPIEKPLEKTRFSLRDYFSLLNAFALFSFIFKTFFQERAKRNLRSEKIKKPSALNRVCYNLFALAFKKENHLNKILEKRKENGLSLRKELTKVGFVCQPSENNAFTFLTCLCPPALNRDKLVITLRKKGIFATRIWKEPITYKEKQFFNTAEIAQRIINFPLQNFFTQKDLKKITDKIKSLL